MPYYAWNGVTLKATACKGIQFARTPAELEHNLFKKDIALLAYRIKKLWWRSISLKNKIDYFTQITFLIKAGMLLPEALDLVAQQSPRSFAQVTAGITDEVKHGVPFSQALASQKNLFDSLMIQMTAVGQEAGSLPQSLQVLVMHLESMAAFRARLRGALFLPLITFCFFLLIIALVLIIVVPQFSSVFASLGKQMPASTQFLLRLSYFMSSWMILALAIVCIGFIFFVYHYKKTKLGALQLDALVLKLPGIKNIVVAKVLSGYFKSLALLLSGGLPLPSALRIASESISNQIIKGQVDAIRQEVKAGDSFAQALARYEYFSDPEIISLIQVGQESGTLTHMMERIAGAHQERLIQNLTRITMLFQPFLLIILGLLIMSLILALYMPILSLSYAF